MDNATDTTPENKACTGCGIVKPLTDFSFDKRHADGRQSRCKACFNAHKKLLRETDGDHVRVLRREEYQRNRERYLSQSAARRDAERGGPPTRIFGDTERRFWSYVQKTETCWLWTGALDETGYGVFNMGAEEQGRTRNAHVWAYEHFVGPVPEGLELDHVKANGCTHRNCVNFESHLEPVTHQENMRRSRSTKLSDADVLRAWQLVQGGLSMRAVGRQYGVSHNTLSYRFKSLALVTVT